MPFKKGVSGNPKGRPEIIGPVRELARQHSEEALRKQIALMRDAEDERVQLAAANDILDRAWGKVAQAVEVTGEGGGPMSAMVQIVFSDGKRSKA